MMRCLAGSLLIADFILQMITRMQLNRDQEEQSKSEFVRQMYLYSWDLSGLGVLLSFCLLSHFWICSAIRKIPDSIATLQVVAHLNLSANPIETFSVAPAHAPHLDLSHCGLKETPDWMWLDENYTSLGGSLDLKGGSHLS